MRTSIHYKILGISPLEKLSKKKKNVSLNQHTEVQTSFVIHLLVNDLILTKLISSQISPPTFQRITL